MSDRKYTTTDSSYLFTSDILYVDFAFTNAGKGSISTTFYAVLYIDGVKKQTWSQDSLPQNYYRYVKDYYIGSLSKGWHTVKIKIDSTNTINETSEYDNEYSKEIYVR